jgi:hypothetical protein
MGTLAAMLAVAGCADFGADESGGQADTSGAATSGDETASATAADSDGAGGGGDTGLGPAKCEDGDDGWAGDDGVTTGGDESGGDGGTFGMDDDMPLATSVFEVQQGIFFPGTLVSVEGVVVTTPSTRTETGAGFEVFVQDPVGGPYSGVRLRFPSDPASLAALGDALSVVGRVYDREGFYLLDISGPQSGVVSLGPGVVPPPVVVPAADLGPGSALARPYEGVPIRVEQVTVTDASPCDGEFVIEQTVRVDDRFAPGQLAPVEGDMLSAIEGVLVYAVDAFEIAPRDASGIQ